MELQELISAKADDKNVQLYMNSMLCSIHYNTVEIKLSLVDAVFYFLSIWCESKLQDYHLHFSQVISLLKELLHYLHIFLSEVCDCHRSRSPD